MKHYNKNLQVSVSLCAVCHYPPSTSKGNNLYSQQYKYRLQVSLSSEIAIFKPFLSAYKTSRSFLLEQPYFCILYIEGYKIKVRMNMYLRETGCYEVLKIHFSLLLLSKVYQTNQTEVCAEYHCIKKMSTMQTCQANFL